MSIPTIQERTDLSVVRSHKYAMMHAAIVDNEEEQKFLLDGAYLYWKEIERRGLEKAKIILQKG